MDNYRNGSQPNKDMTQRVPVQNTPRSSNSQRNNKKKWYMSRSEKAALITLGSIAGVLLLIAAILIFGITAGWFDTAPDDGRILKGVYAAGVNLGGMSKGEAKAVLNKATTDYADTDMVVDVLGTQIFLSPNDTGASLDVDAVVEAAYQYGRTGSRSEREQAKKNAAENSVAISIIEHLNLDTNYIRKEINELGTQFSSTLSQPKLTLKGTRPELDFNNPDTGKVYQTLEIYVGTAEYGLDTNQLYSQVLEHYNIHIFKVEGACTVDAPDSFDEELKQYYDELCVAPIDAKQESDNKITPEVYGYGFNLNDVKELLAKTPYGETVTIELRYLKPNITQESLYNQTFKDILGEDSSLLGTDEAWNTNVDLACKELNGKVLWPGDEFSFNEVLGELTAEKGYLEAMAYLDRVMAPTLGGGVSHVASVLYTSALEAGLTIQERHGHSYVTTFVTTGRDAYVDDVKDFRFTNSLSNPILIRAEVVEGELKISIEGTEYRSYTTELVVKVTESILPGKLYNTMLPNNPGNYQEGDILEEGLEGCVVEIYIAEIDEETGVLLNETFCNVYSYEAKDSVVVKLLVTEPAL